MSGIEPVEIPDEAIDRAVAFLRATAVSDDDE